MEASLLQNVWFLLFGVLIAGYAVLDGFDLGVGILSLFSPSAEERRLFVNAIAPVWDGNEVWLLTGGGALFAAFPPVYASAFSAFYLALMVLLVALILRAVSMEFRAQVDSAAWRRIWDFGFGIGSLLPPILFGVAVGNVLRGMAIDIQGNYTGTFFDLLHPYALLVGVLSLVMCIAHGALYMAQKSTDSLRERMIKWAKTAWLLWVVMLIGVSVATWFWAPERMQFSFSWLWLVLALLVSALFGMRMMLAKRRLGLSFFFSALAVASMVGLVGVSLYPNLLPSLTDPAFHLSVASHSSSERTLSTMLWIALIGMPLVILYTFFIYRVFKGKVVLDEYSY